MSWSVNLANTGEAAKWMAYSTAQNSALEAAYNSKVKSLMLSDEYKIDYTKMRQIRRDDASRWREIRRVEAKAAMGEDVPASAIPTAAAGPVPAKPTKKRGAAAASTATTTDDEKSPPAASAMEDEPVVASSAKASKRPKAAPAAAPVTAPPEEKSKPSATKRGKVAAAAATQPAAAAPVREKRVSRRKRADAEEEDEEKQETKDNKDSDAEEEDAPATAGGRASKRARPTREKKPASRAASPAMVDDADEAAADEDDDAADEDEEAKPKSAVQIALDGFTAKAVGCMFASAGLSLPLALSILDALAVREIALWAAPVSKQWYATAVESAAAVQAIAKKNATEGTKATAPAAKRGAAASSSSSAAAAAVSSSSNVPGSSRSDVVAVTGKTISSLCASRLRGLVTAIKTKAHVFHGVHHSSLDVKAVTALSEVLPYLRELQLNISSTSVTPVFQFPPHLRDLSVAVESKVAPSKQRMKKTLTAPAKSWTAEKTEAFILCVVEHVAKIKSLRTLIFGSAHQYGGNAAKATPEWIEPFAALPHLQTLYLTGGAVTLLTVYGAPGSPAAYWITHKMRDNAVDLSNRTIAVLRKFPSLTSLPFLGQGQGAVAALLPALLAPGHPFKLTELPLSEATITADLRKPLATLKPWLTSLAPLRWDLKDVSWLAAFKACTRLLFDPTPPPPQPAHHGYGPPPVPAPPPEVPSVDAVVELLEKMPWVVDLSIRYEDLTDQHLARILAALPKLQTLQVRSKAITTLAPFTARKSAHLASTLHTLAIHTPSVPRDDSEHLLSLTALRALDISGSFSEPLFAKQLAPFQPPYPKAPLHWLRKFVPRSAAEAVPTPAVTLEAREAAFADFEARILAGDVCSAELLNSSQLSVVMQFLTMHDFCAAARTCRAWRAAASLPSAWPPVERTEIKCELKGSSVDTDKPNRNARQYGVILSSKKLHARSRRLKMADTQPQCSLSILPHLHILKHARALDLQMQPHYSYQVTPEVTEQAEKSLQAVASLARLESFSADFTACHILPAVNRLMQAIGPKLRRATLYGLPSSAFASLTGLECLSLSGDSLNPAKPDESTAPGSELAVLRRLKYLAIRTSAWRPELPETLRALSADHALRALNITHCTARQGYWNQQHEADPAHTLAFMPFVRALTAALSGTASRNSGDSSASSSAAAAASSVMGLDDDDERVPTSSASTPAKLEILRIRTDAYAEPPRAAFVGGPAVIPADPFPLESILRIPSLRVLELESMHPMPLDLTPLETLPSLPPLECLGLTMAVVASSFVCLRLLKGLKQLRLADGGAAQRALWEYGYPHGGGAAVVLPKGALGPICRALKELELLDLSVELAHGELGALASLQNLHTLRMCSQPNLLPSDFAFLPQLPHLSELFLDRLTHVPLQNLNWMVEREGVEEEAMDEALASGGVAGVADELVDAAAAAAAGEDDAHMADAPVAAAAAASSSSAVAAATAASSLPAADRLAARGYYPPSSGPDVLTLVGGCSALRSFWWSSAPSVLKSAERYTSRHTTYKCKGRVSQEEQRRRDQKERVRERHALRSLLRKRNEAIAAAEANSAAKAASSLLSDDDSGAASSRSSVPPPLTVLSRAPPTNLWSPSEAWVPLCLLPSDPSEVERATAAAAARKAREPVVAGRAARWRPPAPLAPPDELAAADALVMDEETRLEAEGRAAEADREAEREAAREAAKLNPKKKKGKKY